MEYNYKRMNQFPVSADIAGKRLEELNEEKGAVTPQIVVDDARPEEAVLHPCFEWDDPVAAEKYRLVQARHLIRSVVIQKNITSQEEPVSVRAFVSTARTNPIQAETQPVKVYKPLDDVLNNPVSRDALIKTAYKELLEWHNKYLVYSELAGYAKEAKGLADKMNSDQIYQNGKPILSRI